MRRTQLNLETPEMLAAFGRAVEDWSKLPTDDGAEFDREVGVFERTLWTWLGGAVALLSPASAIAPSC